MRICVIYKVARREKHEVNLYYDYRRKYIYTTESFYCVSLTLQSLHLLINFLKNVVVAPLALPTLPRSLLP